MVGYLVPVKLIVSSFPIFWALSIWHDSMPLSCYHADYCNESAKNRLKDNVRSRLFKGIFVVNSRFLLHSVLVTVICINLSTILTIIKWMLLISCEYGTIEGRRGCSYRFSDFCDDNQVLRWKWTCSREWKLQYWYYGWSETDKTSSMMSTIVLVCSDYFVDLIDPI